MEYIAVSKNVKMSPRKVRLVANAIKTLKIEEALSTLEHVQKRAALPIRKTIKSALSNAQNNHGAKAENLLIKEIKIDEGIRYKRYHYAGRGRIHPYIRRSSHITVIINEKAKKETEKKEAKPNKKGVSKKK